MGEYTEKQQKNGSERKQFLQRQVKQSKRRNAVPKVIPRAIAQEFEQKTGYSSANIRVSESDMPDLFGAKAATQGNEIHFPRGRYQPETAEGRRILKHEMRHTIQQTRNEVATNVDGVVNNEKGKEAEADRGFEGFRALNEKRKHIFSDRADNAPIQCCFPKPPKSKAAPPLKATRPPKKFQNRPPITCCRDFRPEPSTVYRVIRSDENPEAGLHPKVPDRNMSIEGHVVSGSRNLGSQFISVTAALGVAKSWAKKSGNRIVCIDTTQLPEGTQVHDLSTEEGRNNHLRGKTAKRFSDASSEMLIQGSVPKEAITLYQEEQKE